MDSEEAWVYQVTVVEEDEWDICVSCEGAASLFTAVHAAVGGDYDIRYITKMWDHIILTQKHTPMKLGMSPHFLGYVTIINRRQANNNTSEPV